MRSIALAALFALSASSVMAFPSMPFPDLSFPEPTDGGVSQGCSSISTGKIVCE